MQGTKILRISIQNAFRGARKRLYPRSFFSEEKRQHKTAARDEHLKGTSRIAHDEGVHAL